MERRVTDLLVPRDLLKPSLPDEHFRGEADAARQQSINVQLIDHEALTTGDIATGVRNVDPTTGNAVYRGWMINPDRYRDMAAVLKERGVSLMTTPEQFLTAHHLPRWYASVSTLTPESVWTTTSEHADLVEALRTLGSGAAILKDYSK